MATLREVKKRIRTAGLALMTWTFVLGFGHEMGKAETNLSIGPKVGVSLTSPYVDDWSDTYFKTGFSGGVFLDIELSDHISLQTEALYVKKVPTYELFQLIGRLNAAYMEIPVTFKWKASPPGRSSVHLFAGGAPAINISASTRYGSGFAPGGGVILDVKDEVNNFDFSLVFGISIAFPAGSGRLIFDFRYNHGMLSVFNTEYFTDTKNRNLILMMGYAIPLGS